MASNPFQHFGTGEHDNDLHSDHTRIRKDKGKNKEQEQEQDKDKDKEQDKDKDEDTYHHENHDEDVQPVPPTLTLRKSVSFHAPGPRARSRSRGSVDLDQDQDLDGIGIGASASASAASVHQRRPSLKNKTSAYPYNRDGWQSKLFANFLNEYVNLMRVIVDERKDEEEYDITLYQRSDLPASTKAAMAAYNGASENVYHMHLEDVIPSVLTEHNFLHKVNTEWRDALFEVMKAGVYDIPVWTNTQYSKILDDNSPIRCSGYLIDTYGRNPKDLKDACLAFSKKMQGKHPKEVTKNVARLGTVPMKIFSSL